MAPPASGRCRNVRFILRHRLADVLVEARVFKGRAPVVLAVELRPAGAGGPRRPPGSVPAAVRPYCRMIRELLDGKDTGLARIPIDLSRATPFKRAVLRSARRIPFGTTVSYARLADMAGRPGAVRAAASVMRSNPFPLIVPCHRVILGNGSMGGFMGRKQGRPVALKRSLLLNEKR